MFQDIVVVHDLAKADAVAGQVAVAVEEDEDAVECEAGHRRLHCRLIQIAELMEAMIAQRAAKV